MFLLCSYFYKTFSPVNGENYPRVNNWGCFIKELNTTLGENKVYTPMEHPLTHERCLSLWSVHSFVIKFLREI